MNRAALIGAIKARNEAVTASIPNERLLPFEAKQGWARLCTFLDVPVPLKDYPRSNSKLEFWEHLADQ